MAQPAVVPTSEPVHIALPVYTNTPTDTPETMVQTTVTTAPPQDKPDDNGKGHGQMTKGYPVSIQIEVQTW